MGAKTVRLVSDHGVPSSETTAITSAWRRFVNARSHRKPFRNPIFAECFVAHALGHPVGVWTLQVSRSGDGILQCNDCAAARLFAHEGVSLLNRPGCPFERAVEFIAALSNRATHPLHSTTRTEFEFELARWIAQYLDVTRGAVRNLPST